MTGYDARQGQEGIRRARLHGFRCLGRREKGCKSLPPKAPPPEPPLAKPSPQPAKPEPRSAPAKAPPPEPPLAKPSPQPAKPEPRSVPAESSPPSGSGSFGFGWVIVGVIVLVIWIANSGTGNKSQPAPSYSPPPSYSSPAPAAAPAPTPAPAVPVSDEQKPPVGQDNVLNIPQIRWCKREKIRIEAIESVINNAYDHEVDKFNAKASDYNSRCGKFRYRRGDVEQVDRELAYERESIASKEKSEWVQGSQLPSPSRSPDTETRSPQIYDEGSRGYKSPSPSKPTARQRIGDPTASSPSSMTTQTDPQIVVKPENSSWIRRFGHRTNEWQCNIGFKKIEDACEQLPPPPENAAYMRMNNDQWECKDGYLQIVVGGPCVISGTR